MHVELLQPWVTIQGNAQAVTSVTQDPETWLDLGDCCDVTCWIDVRQVSSLQSGTLTLTIESSPNRDEYTFLPISNPLVVSASSSPIMVSSISGAASLSPTARFMRWVVTSTSANSGMWSVTFRIRVSKARTPYFSPMQVPTCALWLRADLGLSVNTGTTTVTSWLDQTGNTNNTVNAAGTGTVTLSALTTPLNFNGFPAIITSGSPTGWLGTSSSGSGLSISQPDSVIVVVQTAVLNASVPVCYVSGSSSSHQSVAQSANNDLQVQINAGTSVNQAVTSNLLNNPSILQVDFNGASSNIYQNGVLQNTSGALNPGTNALTFAAIGANFNGTNVFDGYIAEVLAFQPVLTPVWRTLVTRYLGGRYGIAVP
jgi:hypothetical protein